MTFPGQPQEQNAGASRSATNRERIAEAIEVEIEVLRQARPHLEARLDRAGSLLVAQISCPPRSRPVRVRIGADGKARFLVASLTSPGVVYQVDAETYSSRWSCSCPDYHRRDAPCKHILASYVLKRVAREARVKPGCSACDGGWVFLEEEVIDEVTGHLVEVHNPVPCRRCRGGDRLPYLNDEQMQEWMASVRWIYAKSMPKHPHEYCMKREQDPERFERVVQTIWDLGWDRMYLRRPWRSLDVGKHYVWVHTRPERHMPAPVEDTILVNRAPRVQERIL